MEEKLTPCKMLNLDKANSLARGILREPLGGFEYKDIVQRLLLRKIEKEVAIEKISELFQHTGWLRRALSNIKNDMIREEKAKKRGGKKSPIPLERVDAITIFATRKDPESLYINEEKKQQNQSLLKEIIDAAKLSENERKILDLTLEEYTSEEIAGIMGISVGAMYTRRSEAKRKMRKAIEAIECDKG